MGANLKKDVEGAEDNGETVAVRLCCPAPTGAPTEETVGS
jgi:hypothetical protein